MINSKKLLLASFLCFVYSATTFATVSDSNLPINTLALVLTTVWSTFPAIVAYFQGLQVAEILNEISMIIEYCFYKKSIIAGNNPSIFSGSETDMDAIETLFTIYPDLMNTVLSLME